MEKYFRIILLTGILMLSVCGCSVKWEEDNTEAPSDFLQDETVIQEPETSGSQTDISQYDYLKEATLETELGTGIVQGNGNCSGIESSVRVNRCAACGWDGKYQQK